jgi:hypothetical protein
VKAIGSLLTVLAVVAIGYFVLKAEFGRGPEKGVPPQETIDVVGVQSDLLAIAQAERLYLASHGSYGSLDELQQEGSITFSPAGRRGYNYRATIDDGQHFRVTASPADPNKTGWPTLAVDETMQITRQ